MPKVDHVQEFINNKKKREAAANKQAAGSINQQRVDRGKQKDEKAKEGKKKDASNAKKDTIEDKIERELYGEAMSNRGAGFSDVEDAQSVKPSLARKKQKKKKDTRDEDDDSGVFSDQGRK